MTDNDYILLKTVKSNGSLLLLRSRGLTPAQIATLIQNQIQLGNLNAESDKLELSSQGESELKGYLLSRNLSEKDSWIFPQKQFYTHPIKEDTIVLPKKKL